MVNELEKYMSKEGPARPTQEPTGDGDVNAGAGAGVQDDKGSNVNVDVDFSTLPEDKVFSFLTGKVGREVKSWEDLVTVKEKEVIKEVEKPFSYATPDLEVIDKFVRETGRGIEDFFKVQKDWDSVKDEAVVKEYIKHQHPTLDDDDVNDLFSEDFEKIPTTEDMDEEEIKAVSKKNRRAELKLKMQAEEARKFFNSQKEQYKTPVRRAEESVNHGKEAWSQNMKAALEGVQKIESEGFTYEFRDREGYNKTFADLDSLLGSFKNEDGTFDYGTLARTIIAGRELPKILEEHAKAIRANTVEDEMKRKSNRQGELGKEEVSKDQVEQTREQLMKLFSAGRR